MERNSLIDGWRGVSVCFVIIGHLIGSRFFLYFQVDPFHSLIASPHRSAVSVVKNIILTLLAPVPGVGVHIFFVISGYLITRLLLSEECRNDEISIRAFYIRRVCRIIPAFYFYLIGVAVISSVGFVEIPKEAFYYSGLFLCDLPFASCTWFFGHTWSLAVEEQFYLVWPLMFLLLGPRWRIVGLVGIFFALMIASRYSTLSLGFLSIMVGALFAASPRINTILKKITSPNTIIFSSVLLFVQPFFASFPTLHWLISAVRPFLLVIIVFGTVDGIGPLVAVVSWEWLRKVGLMSYSFYLWQQLATAKPSAYGNHELILIPMLSLIPPILSYYIVEKPMIKFGHKLSGKILRSKGRAHSLKASDLISETSSRVFAFRPALAKSGGERNERIEI